VLNPRFLEEVFNKLDPMKPKPLVEDKDTQTDPEPKGRQRRGGDMSGTRGQSMPKTRLEVKEV